MFGWSDFWLETRVIKKMIPHMKPKVFFIRKNKTKFFFWKKIQNGRLKKRSFFKIANSQYFLVKISWIGPWVSRIEWCEGHWNGSTYMVVRLSDIRSETAKKGLFCVFMPFLSLLCWTASRPYGLSQINALRIIQSHQPKDQSMKFSQKILRIGRAGKWPFFLGGHFDFFCFIPIQISHNLWGTKVET